MSDVYGASFARAHKALYGSYAEKIGARILERMSAPGGAALDLCCGAGELAVFLARQGFSVTAVDRSATMLDLARVTCAGLPVQLLEQDVTKLEVAGPFCLITSISHSLNHLPDTGGLHETLSRATEVAEAGSLLVFDLITRRGLEVWNTIAVDDLPEQMIVRRGFYDPAAGVGYRKMSGFLSTNGGLYERFDVLLRYAAYEMQAVSNILQQLGWSPVVFTSRRDLETPLEDPEKARDVVVLAWKG